MSKMNIEELTWLRKCPALSLLVLRPGRWMLAWVGRLDPLGFQTGRRRGIPTEESPVSRRGGRTPDGWFQASWTCEAEKNRLCENVRTVQRVEHKGVINFTFKRAPYTASDMALNPVDTRLKLWVLKADRNRPGNPTIPWWYPIL